MKKFFFFCSLTFLMFFATSCRRIDKDIEIKDLDGALYSAEISDEKILFSIQDLNTKNINNRKMKSAQLKKGDFIHAYSPSGKYAVIKSKNGENTDKLFSFLDLKIVELEKARTELIGETKDKLYMANYSDSSVTFFSVNKESKEIKEISGSISLEEDFLLTKATYDMNSTNLYFSYTNMGKSYIATFQKGALEILMEMDEMYTDFCLINLEKEIWYAGYNNASAPYLFLPKIIQIQQEHIVSSQVVESMKDEMSLHSCFIFENNTVLIFQSGMSVYLYIYKNDLLSSKEQLQNFDLKSTQIIDDYLYLFDGENNYSMKVR